MVHEELNHQLKHYMYFKENCTFYWHQCLQEEPLTSMEAFHFFDSGQKLFRLLKRNIVWETKSGSSKEFSAKT